MNNSLDPERMLRGIPAPDALPDIGAAAALEDLLDVAYTIEDTPAGRLLLAATPRGLVRLAYLDHSDEDAVLEHLASHVSPECCPRPGHWTSPGASSRSTSRAPGASSTRHWTGSSCAGSASGSWRPRPGSRSAR